MLTTPKTHAQGAWPAIEVKVDRVSQLFQSLDPLPFRERDLDADAEEFIVSWARELPRDKAIDVIVHVPEAELQSEMARGFEGAFRSYFAYRAELASRELRELFRTGRISIVVGLLLLAICVFASQLATQLVGKNEFGRFVSEGFFILGWVANWKPIEIFLFDWWPITRRRRLFLRLAQASVAFSR